MLPTLLSLLVTALPMAPQEEPSARPSPDWFQRSWMMRQQLEPPLVLEGVNVVDVTSGEVRADVRIVVRAGRIESIGDAPAPAQAEVLELPGRWVVPGLFDLHAHVVPPSLGYSTAEPEDVLATLLDHGVTTLRLLPFYTESAVDWAGRIAAGDLLGPTIVPTSGVYERFPQRTSRGFENPDEAVLWLQRDHLLGARWIKVYNSMDEASLEAIVEAAHELGMRVCGHAEEVPPARAAELGMDCLEHIISFPLSCAEQPVLRGGQDLVELTALRWEAVDDGRLEGLLELLRRSGTAWVPTLVVSEQMARAGSHDGQPVASARVGGRLDAALERAARAAVAQHRAGGLVGLGTDFPVDGVEPGSSAHRELELLVTLGGATPREALEIGTLGSARVLGLETLLGTVEVDKLAELVVLREDPLSDVRHTRSIELVLHGGRIHRPAR